MISHRVATKPTLEPPVGFYKTVAISFFLVTVILLGIVIFITSKKATITILAKEDEKSINLTVNVESNRRGSNTVSGAASSSLFTWAQKYYPSGAKTILGLSEGEIIIYNKTNFIQPLVKTTRFLAPSGVLFRLLEKVTVPARGQVSAKVYADQPGTSGDIGPSTFTIPGLMPEKQKYIYAESAKPMSGGTKKVDIITADDIANAEKDFKDKTKEAFLATLQSADVALNEVIVSVIDQQIKADHNVGDETNEFNISGENTMVMVTANKKELTDIINKGVEAKIDPASEKILAMGANPQLSLVSYDLENDTAQLSVYQSMVVTLDANAEKLSVQNFLGKKKEEIERYLLGLDHVAGVEVKFSPVWMLSAPSVPERIKIMVRNVK